MLLLDEKLVGERGALVLGRWVLIGDGVGALSMDCIMQKKHLLWGGICI